MNVKIIDLKHEPAHLAQLAKWHHEEWSYLNPAGTLEARTEKMRHYLQDDPIPSTFIAKTDDQLAGSAAIVVADMDTHPEYTPWLASVFVTPEKRRNGIGTALVKHVMAHASKHGVAELYLFTPDQEAFYQRLGWATLANEQYQNCPVTIMKATLSG